MAFLYCSAIFIVLLSTAVIRCGRSLGKDAKKGTLRIIGYHLEDGLCLFGLTLIKF